ncbi:MAG: DNA polymerase I [Deltaproteobacteria bacterium]|nr:DNA polymerase I [Deltaproteobacteria bacterium]
MGLTFKSFQEIWVIDFEFNCPPGERPTPICLVGHEFRLGRAIRLWIDGLSRMTAPPFGPDALIVCFYASAEMGCYLALDWPFPTFVVDLFTEFRCITNGLSPAHGAGLLGAALHYGIKGIEKTEKDSMRDLAIRGGPFTKEEQAALLDYCESDVDLTAKLLNKMVAGIDLPRALWRGRYMQAVARMEFVGVPIDTVALNQLRDNWVAIQDDLIAKIDVDYNVFDGRTFKDKLFEQWLSKSGIPWPRLESGKLDKSDDTFKEMARAYPEVAPLRELRAALSQMRLSDFPVGRDGRNRTLLSPFRARTGRNQPSNSKFIFGPSAWLRSLIKPEPGFGIAYVDWSQQEFGIAAYLSKDENMIQAYESGDPYLEFAKLAGAVPPDGTKKSHPTERNLYKSCVLGVQYGMGAKSLASRIGQPPIYAEELLRKHHDVFHGFWRWSGGVLDYALIHKRLWTTLGWKIRLEGKINPRSVGNFPMQANGAEMLRLACIFATEQGIEVVAPVHDAVLIRFPLDQEEETISATQTAMSDASAAVLDGPRIRTDVEIVRYPDRYRDKRGSKMWQTVFEIIKIRQIGE